MFLELQDLLEFGIKEVSLHTDFSSYIFLDLVDNGKQYTIRYEKTKYRFSFGADPHRPFTSIERVLDKEKEKQLFVWLRKKIGEKI